MHTSKPQGFPAITGSQDITSGGQEPCRAPAAPGRINISLSSERASSSKVSHSTRPTSISQESSTTSSGHPSKVEFSRVERYALAMIESQVIRLGESESFWTSLASQGTPNLEDQLELDYPPLFQALCVCDASLKGSPIYLSSSENRAGCPRTLDVGAVRFLNLPDLGERCRLLTTSLGPDKKPRFYIELVSALLDAADTCNSGYALVARMDITESILILARRLLERYEIGEPDGDTKGMSMSLLDDEDWQVAAGDALPGNALPAVTDRLSNEFRAPVPMGDPDIIEFHLFVEDISWFHRDAFILSPSSETWQITHISTPLASVKDDLSLGLSPNAPAVLQELGRDLAGSKPLSRAISWGPGPAQKRVYCVPMFRRERSCWLCFLLEITVPDLWRDLKNSVLCDSYK